MSDSQVYETDNYRYGDSIVEPESPSKEGYVFRGWTPEVPATMPDENLTVESVFSYPTLTFYVDGVVYTTITQEYGSSVTAPEDPSKTGYSFTGWSPQVPATMPAEDQIITAQFQVNQYTLTFKVEDEVYATITQNYGTSVTPPTNPT